MKIRISRSAVLVLALGLALTTSACADQHDRATAEVKGDEQTVTVELVDDAFRPITVGAKGGLPIRLRLSNRGIQHHTFTDESAGIDVEVAPGKSETVTVPALPAGANRFFLCRFHEASGMKGKISFVSEL